MHKVMPCRNQKCKKIKNMQILSLNVNGIRSAQRKGLWEWLTTFSWDILCVQEIRSDHLSAQSPINQVNSYCFPAIRPGYSGTAIYSKKPIPKLTYGINVEEFDQEGRVLIGEWPHLRIVSLYFPSGSSSPERQLSKFRFLVEIEPFFDKWRKDTIPTILCGDFNIAHQPLDLKNWKGNLKNSGFLPEEREWVGNQIHKGWKDIYRHLYPEHPGYTWWSNRGQAYTKDVGWRIDYQWTNPIASNLAKNAYVYKEQRFSDHAPLIIEYPELSHP
jgi:exodeoxyribonuclease III